jgi:hypothetical protein
MHAAPQQVKSHVPQPIPLPVLLALLELAELPPPLPPLLPPLLDAVPPPAWPPIPALVPPPVSVSGSHARNTTLERPAERRIKALIEAILPEPARGNVINLA